MKISRLFLNRLQTHPPFNDTVVVIDVLRSFATAAVAFRCRVSTSATRRRN